MRISFLRSALMTGAFVLAAAQASAQDYGPPPGPEEVPVIAPRIHVEPSKRIDGTPEKLTMSVNVRYDDLNLRTRDGARELRLRVRESARDVCRELFETYPAYQMPGTNCYKDAVQDALVHADEAISDARDTRSYND